MSNLFKLKPQVSRTVVDSEQLTKLFEKYKIIPYYGVDAQTSHSTLDLFQSLTAMSPTFTSAINNICKYSFGRGVTIAPRMIDGIFVDEEEIEVLSREKQLAYSNLLKSYNINLASVSGWSKKLIRYLKDSGNAYIKLKRVTIGDISQYFIDVLHYRQVAYLEAAKGESEDYVIYTKIWNEKYWEKNPPLLVRVTKQNADIKWDITEEGVECAIIHVQTDSDNDPSDFYSRPDIIAVLDWLYVDIELGSLNGKIAGTEIITKKILAFEAPDPNTIDPDDDTFSETEVIASDTQSINGTIAAGAVVTKTKKEDYFDKNMRRLRMLTTQLGGYDEVNSLAGVEYPFGQKQPIPIDIEVNRDTNHHKFQCETAASKVCSNLNWSPVLNFDKEANSGIGGNVLKDLFVIGNEGTIIPIQSEISTIWNNIFSQILTAQNVGSEFIQYGIKFPDIISRLVEKLSKASTSVTITEPAVEPPNE